MEIPTSNPRPRVAATLFAPVITGLVTTQIMAAGFVYLSNQRVLALATAAVKAGYFPIPTGPAAASLSSFGAAFWGGLFYTLSIGVGLTLLTWAVFHIWRLLFQRSRPVLILYAMLWIGLLVAVNLKGVVLFPSLFCLLTPLSTAYACLKAVPGIHNSGRPLWILPVLTLVILTGLWATQLNRDLFAMIRDQILLSNAVGRRVNDFYYRYTLYAAEAFKSFNQKTLRSCSLEMVEDEQSVRIWTERLAHRDVLALSQINRPDIRLIFSQKGLRLAAPNGQGIETTAEEFTTDPNRILQSFSKATDRFAPLRRLTLAGLLLGFPILLFAMVYGALLAVAGRLLKLRQATWAASGVCMIIGILLFLPMLKAHPDAIAENNIDAALAADQWTRRVAALRYIEGHNLEIDAYPHYRHLLTSPMVVERYWVARAMAKSRAHDTFTRLLAMMDDPHPNVICQVFYALGEQHRRMAIDPIKQRLQSLENWYAQWYGYGALRKLGWRQARSN